MKNKQAVFSLIFAALVGMVASANAQDKSTSGCDNLNAFSETPNVDYYTQIQPIWDQQCGSCHLNGGHKAGLRLDRSQSYRNQINVRSDKGHGLNLIQPFDTSRSYSFVTMNCSHPGGVSRMPTNRTTSKQTQALIRDWINQGALEVAVQNAAPQAADDSLEIGFGESNNIDVLSNDSDPDGDSLTVESVGESMHGMVVLNADQSINYSPDFGFSGTDSFDYTINDGNQAVSTATVTITVDVALFDMNFGLSGSWYNPQTPGQGFDFEVVPSQNVIVFYWYTFSVDGSGRPLWLFGAAPYAGNSAVIELSEVTGGQFNLSGGAVSDVWGSVNLTFDDCTHGHLSFLSDLDNASGSMDIVRITDDEMCQPIIDAMMAQ